MEPGGSGLCILDRRKPRFFASPTTVECKSITVHTVTEYLVFEFHTWFDS